MAIPLYLLTEAAASKASTLGPRLAALLATLAKGGKGLGTIASKIPLSLSIPGMFLGQEIFGQVGAAKERGVAREELALQKLLAETTTKTQKQLTEEARRGTKETTKQQIELIREQVKEARETEAMRLFSESQERQVAMLLAALQISQSRPTGAPTSAGAGMLGLLKQEF